MPTKLGSVGQAFHRVLAMTDCLSSPTLDFSLSLLQSFMRAPLYRGESTPMPKLGEMTYFIREVQRQSLRVTSKEITTGPLIFRKRRSCRAQTHSLLSDGKSSFLSVGQSIPGAFFSPRTVCNCVIQPSPIVPKS